MNLGGVLGRMYPGADPAMDYEVREDPETGSHYIARWDEAKLGRKPTQEEIDSEFFPALREDKKREIRRELVERSEALMPVYELIYCIRNRVADTRLAELDALGKRARDLEAYIDHSSRTVAELETLTWESTI